MSTKIIRSFAAVALMAMLFAPLVIFAADTIANIGTDSAPALPSLGACSYSAGVYTFTPGSIFSGITEEFNVIAGTPLATVTDALHNFTSAFGCSDYVSFVIWYLCVTLLVVAVVSLLSVIMLFPVKILERWL